MRTPLHQWRQRHIPTREIAGQLVLGQMQNIPQVT